MGHPPLPHVLRWTKIDVALTSSNLDLLGTAGSEKIKKNYVKGPKSRPQKNGQKTLNKVRNLLINFF